ncbi:hypothetical protein pb186bvf_007649 [Paramecium bursaria]
MLQPIDYSYTEMPHKDSQLIVDRANELQPLQTNLQLVNQHLINHFGSVKYKQYNEQLEKAINRSTENVKRYHTLSDNAPINPLEKIRNKRVFSPFSKCNESKITQISGIKSTKSSEFKIQLSSQKDEIERLRQENQKLKQIIKQQDYIIQHSNIESIMKQLSGIHASRYCQDESQTQSTIETDTSQIIEHRTVLMRQPCQEINTSKISSSRIKGFQIKQRKSLLIFIFLYQSIPIYIIKFLLIQ